MTLTFATISITWAL